MKKAFALFLALVMCLSLAACGNRSETPKQDATEQPTTTEAEPLMFKVGDTVCGKTGDVTVTSVEFVDKIENGLFFNMWSPGNEQSYQDVTAEDGYSIVKISYLFEYTAKSSGDMCLAFSLDYDNGYIFEGNSINHAVPKSEIGVGFERKYAFNQDLLFVVSDPLAFQDKESCCYIFVNNAVIEHPEKALVLNVGIPTQTLDIFELGSISAESFEYDTFIFDLADISREITFSGPTDEELCQEAIALMEGYHYIDAAKILMEIADNEQANALLLECCVKGYDSLCFNYLNEHKDEFRVVPEEEMKAILIASSWMNKSGETWQFFADNNLDLGRTRPSDGAKVIVSWSLQGDVLTIGYPLDNSLVMREVYDGAFVLYTEDGKIYQTLWSVE